MATIDVRSKEVVNGKWRVSVAVDGRESTVASLYTETRKVVEAHADNVLAGRAVDSSPAGRSGKAAFSDLAWSYFLAKRSVDTGVGTTTQGDVDALMVEIKAAYKDEYAPILAAAV